MTRGIFLSLALVASACTVGSTNNTTGPTQTVDQGKVQVFSSTGGVDVEIDSAVAPLAFAATVAVEGATISGPATLGSAAEGRDLFTQNTSGGELRFAISDARGLRIKSRGVVVHIPLQGLPSKVTIKNVSAADGEGNAFSLTAFDAAPGRR